VRVAAGGDRFGERIKLGGVSPNDCKVAAKDTDGAMSVFESTAPRKGGPPRHVHEDQDEWFFVLEGKFDFQVGDGRFRLRAGDSVFAPRKVAHAWACVSDKPGKMMIVFQPAGKMEEFFRELGKRKGPPSAEEAQRLFLAHGMKVVGPPLKID
jgi:quercetin dioxygenase-like cupin family protein